MRRGSCSSASIAATRQRDRSSWRSCPSSPPGAVAGRSLEHRVALGAADLGAEAMPVVLILEASSLLRSEGLRDRDSVEVYHHRIRESVLGALSSEVLAGHHRALGEALESFGDG